MGLIGLMAFGINANAALQTYSFETDAYTIIVTSTAPVSFENNILTYDWNISRYEVGNGYYASAPAGTNYGEYLSTRTTFKLKDGYALTAIQLGAKGEYSMQELFTDYVQGAQVTAQFSQSISWGSTEENGAWLNATFNSYLESGVYEKSGSYELGPSRYVPIDGLKEFEMFGNTFNYADAGSVMQYICEFPYDNCYVRRTQSIASLTMNSPWVSFEVAQVPEPSSFALVGLGLGVFSLAAVRRNRKTQ